MCSYVSSFTPCICFQKNFYFSQLLFPFSFCISLLINLTFFRTRVRLNITVFTAYVIPLGELCIFYGHFIPMPRVHRLTTVSANIISIWEEDNGLNSIAPETISFYPQLLLETYPNLFLPSLKQKVLFTIHLCILITDFFSYLVYYDVPLFRCASSYKLTSFKTWKRFDILSNVFLRVSLLSFVMV